MIENITRIEDLEPSFTDKYFELNKFQKEEISHLIENVSVEDLSQNETLKNEFIDKVDKEVRLLKPKLNTAIALDRALQPTMDKFLKNLDSKYLEAPSDIKQIKEISDYLSHRKDLKFENWKELSLEQKIGLLNKLEKDISKIEHRPPLNLQATKLEEGCWGRNYGDRMEINEKYLNESSVDERSYWETLDTLIHEGRHTYQNYNLTTRNIHSRPSQVEDWRENHARGYENGVREIPIFGIRYTNSELERGYRFQPVELDARGFAKDCITQLKEKVHGNVDIYEQYQEKNRVTSKEDSGTENKPIEGIGTLAKENLFEMSNVESVKVEPSFTGKYTETEIRKMEEIVSDCKSAVSRMKSDVHHWENCYSLSHNPSDLSHLNDAKSKLRDAESNLKNAESKLRNAK